MTAVGRRRRTGVAACALAVTVACGAGCGGERDPVPDRLLDGREPPPPPAALAYLDSAVMTRVVAVGAREALGGRAAGCAERVGVVPGRGHVERVGVVGRSLTWRARGGQYVLGCDRSARAEEPHGYWCSASAGKLRAGRLTDARVSLVNCVDVDDRPVAFAWIEPPTGARWLAVDHDGYTEVYEVASDLPVRIATTRGVDVANAAVRVAVTFYGPDGRELTQWDRELHVAG